MRALNPRERSIMAVTIALAVFYGGFQFVYKPLKKQEAILEQGISEELKTLKKDFLTVEKEKHLHKFYEKLLTPFEEKRSDEEEVSELLSRMQVLAAETNLRIIEMKPQRPRKTEFCKFLPLSLSLEGSYVDIIRFLYTVQADTYRLGVEELVIEAKPAQPSILSCRVDLSRLLIPAKK